jgi:hypothetical protein
MRNQNIKIDPETDIRIESTEFNFNSHFNYELKSVIIKRNDPDKIRMVNLINDALKSRLYVAGANWSLAQTLSNLRSQLRMRTCYISSYSYIKISLAYHDNIPVAVLLGYSFCDERMINLEVFCKKKYRGNGILTELVKTAIEKNPDSDFFVTKGTKESIPFWRKMHQMYVNNIVLNDHRLRWPNH